MTEQEKREMAIAKMLKDTESPETNVAIEQYAHIVSLGGFPDFARAYDAGYRKELDTIKEVLSIVDDSLSTIDSRMNYLSLIEDKLEGYEKDDLERALMQLEYNKSALSSLYDKITERYGIEEVEE